MIPFLIPLLWVKYEISCIIGITKTFHSRGSVPLLYYFSLKFITQVFLSFVLFLVLLCQC